MSKWSSGKYNRLCTVPLWFKSYRSHFYSKMTDAGSSYRHTSCRAQPRTGTALQISYLKCMISSLSVPALLKYKLAVSGHKNRRSFQCRFKLQAPVLLRLKPCRAERRIYATLQISYLKSMVYRLSVAALLKLNSPFLDIKIAGLSKRVIEKNLRLNIN